MARKNLLYAMVVMVGIFFISGCQSVPKKYKEEVSGIKSRVETLETRVEGVETKQQEVDRFASEQAQALQEMKAVRENVVQTNVAVKARPRKSRAQNREIQTCLKNAGFYNGKIDGVKGKSTKRAIKEFQKANGLKADGVVGPKTWDALSRYASGGIASQGAMKSEEGSTK